jgi:ribosomal protein L14
MDPYKGYTIKRINKGKVAGTLIARQVYNYKHKTGFKIAAKANVGILLKNDNSFLSEHILGPCFRLIKRKKLTELFKAFI